MWYFYINSFSYLYGLTILYFLKIYIVLYFDMLISSESFFNGLAVKVKFATGWTVRHGALAQLQKRLMQPDVPLCKEARRKRRLIPETSGYTSVDLQPAWLLCNFVFLTLVVFLDIMRQQYDHLRTGLQKIKRAIISIEWASLHISFWGRFRS